MATNATVTGDLEAAKQALEQQMPGAVGTTGDELILAIQCIANEIGELEQVALENADYVPRTDAFKAVTTEAKAFLDTLKKIKTALAVAADLAGAIDMAISYVK